MLDLSAAFDTIDHSILLDRLRYTFGFDCTVLNWFKSYLTDRTQCVSVSNTLSSTQRLCFGVPQGSVLGPILYTLYTTPLGSLIRNHDCIYHMYADDSQIYMSIEPSRIDELVSNVEICINSIREWMLINKLKLNDDKTEVLLLNPRSFEVPVQYTSIRIGEENIEFSESAKNLGVVINNTLSMHDNITNVCKSMYLEIRRMKHMSKYLNENSLKTIASSFILSRLDYCNSLYINIPNESIQKLQKAQNFAARVIFNKPIHCHITPLLVQLHWLPVKARIDYKLGVLTFKCMNNQAPIYLEKLVEKYTPTRSLRSSNTNLLCDKKYNYKSLGERSFAVGAPRLWNSLPVELRMAETLQRFKILLKTHMFRKFYT